MRINLLVIIWAATCWPLSWSQTNTPTVPQPMFDDATKKCLEQEFLSADMLSDFISGKMKVENISTNLKCFVRCNMESRGYMKNGQLLEANVIKDAENLTNAEMLRRVLAECKTLKGKDVCETSFNIFVCLSSKI